MPLPPDLVRIVLEFEPLTCLSVESLEFARHQYSKLEVSHDLQQVLFRRGKRPTYEVVERTGRRGRITLSRRARSGSKDTAVLFSASIRKPRLPRLLYSDSKFTVSLEWFEDPTNPSRPRQAAILTRRLDGFQVTLASKGQRLRVCRVMGIDTEGFRLAQVRNGHLILETLDFSRGMAERESESLRLPAERRDWHVLGVAAIDLLTLVHLAVCGAGRSLLVAQVGRGQPVLASSLFPWLDETCAVRGITNFHEAGIVVGLSTHGKDLLFQISKL
jgi:hypothetical protein